MKNFFLMAALVALALSTSLSRAEDTYQLDKPKEPANIMEKGKSTPMGRMQENMLRMHDQMHKIMDAKTPQEREQLMQEHSQMMEQSMRMMQGMMGSHGKMKGHGKMGGDAKDGNTKDGKMDGSMKGM